MLLLLHTVPCYYTTPAAANKHMTDRQPFPIHYDTTNHIIFFYFYFFYLEFGWGPLSVLI